MVLVCSFPVDYCAINLSIQCFLTWLLRLARLFYQHIMLSWCTYNESLVWLGEVMLDFDTIDRSHQSHWITYSQQASQRQPRYQDE